MMRASWMSFEVGMAVSRSGLLPATNITPANATANIALANLGARHRNESAARESTLGFRSAPDRPEREGTLQRVGFHECAAKAALRPLSTSIFRSSSLRQPISDVSYTIRDTLIEGFSHFVT